ncbi:MAG: RsmF rRNA methyltransferase first C-terminal domain-containing protein, partial [Chloroflexi bacterium]|nr:RsmF rRNA methyltransferase first C-terminal domain-containing protein [Chloroflexota bacterium]
HWGWWLGTLKKKRFEPSHAMAMGLRAEDMRKTLPLTLDDPAAHSYLRGEVLSSPGVDGWVLVTIDGYPLGWGKRVQGRLKTHLPNWLRQF